MEMTQRNANETCELDAIPHTDLIRHFRYGFGRSRSSRTTVAIIATLHARVDRPVSHFRIFAARGLRTLAIPRDG